MQSLEFREDSPRRDVELTLGGGKLYCDRAILVMWSEYFRRKFASKEHKGQKRVELNIEDKNIDDVDELLHVLYPPNKPISIDNVSVVFGLATEFGMREVVRRCETFLVAQPVTPELLLLAQNFRMPALIKKCIEGLRSKTYETLVADEAVLSQLSPQNQARILHERCRYLEGKFSASDKKNEENQAYVEDCITLFDNLTSAVSGFAVVRSRVKPAANSRAPKGRFGTGSEKDGKVSKPAVRKRLNGKEAVRTAVLQVCEEALAILGEVGTAAKDSARGQDKDHASDWQT